MQKKGNRQATLWTIEIIILTFILSMGFNIISQMTVSRANLVVALLLLLAIIFLGVLFDMIGTAAAAATLAPFNAMASRNIKAARTAVTLVQNASKVSSICNDVIGDICGIISGATVAIIIVKIASFYSLKDTVLLSTLLSGAVASLTVGGKAFAKHIAIAKATDIIYSAARVIEAVSIFKRD